MTITKRWLGLRSYEESDATVFFGRNAESEQLFRITQREPLTVVFAASGSGKTSLLRAGLFPKLRQANYLPVRIRLDHSETGGEHADAIRKRLEKLAADEGFEIDSVVPPQAEPDEESLWEYLHRVEFWSPDEELFTPVIVFDQFEEIFTLGHNRPESERFLRLLADLVERRMPEDVRQRLQSRGQRNTIPTDIQRFKIILSLREDFVAQLDDLRPLMPSVMRNRYALRELSGKNAMEVVLGAGEGIVDPDVARRIVRIVSKETEQQTSDIADLTIEPSLLSLVCNELDATRQREGKPKIAADDLKDRAEDILRRFYEESFEDIDPAARCFVEDNLVTATGYRNSQPIDDALAGGLTVEARTKLIDRHILRQSDRRDIAHVELTHDLLTGIVQESRSHRKQKEAEQKQLDAEREQRRKARFYTVASAVLILLSLTAVGFMFKSINAEQKAVRSAERAESLADFMADDLYERLYSIGRLDVLEAVALKAEAYYNDSRLDAGEDVPSGMPKVLHQLGNVLGDRGYIRRAIEVQQDALDLNTNASLGVRIRLGLAKQLVTWGDPDEANGHLQEVFTRVNPSRQESAASAAAYLEARFLAGLLDHRMGRLDDAEAKFRGLIHELDGRAFDAEAWASAGLDASAFRRGLEVEARRALARTCREIGRYAEAITESRRALDAITDMIRNRSGNDQLIYRQARMLRELAALHLDIGDLEGAQDKLNPAIALVNSKESAGRITTGSSDQGPTQWTYLRAELRHEKARAALLRADLEDAVSRTTDAGDPLTEAQAELERAWTAIATTKTDSDDAAGMALIQQQLETEHLTLLADLKQRQGEPLPTSGPYAEAITRVLRPFESEADPSKWNSTELELQALAFAVTVADEDRRSNRPTLRNGVYDRLDDVRETARKNQPTNARWLFALGQAYGSRQQRAIEPGRLSAAYDDGILAFNLTQAAIRHGGPTTARIRHAADAALSTDRVTRSTERAETIREMLASVLSMYRPAEHTGLRERLMFARVQDALVERDPRHEKIAGLIDVPPVEPARLVARFDDELEGDSALIVERTVVTSAMAVPIDRAVSGRATKSGTHAVPEDEIDRLRSAFGLELADGVPAVLIRRERRLAEVSDDALISVSSTPQASNDLSLQLRSPVVQHLIAREQTVIGDRCVLRWEHARSRGIDTRFVVQISNERGFRGEIYTPDRHGENLTDEIVVQVSADEPRYVVDFTRTPFNVFQNGRFFWRVKHAPRGEDAAETGWSNHGTVDVYESTWTRVMQTGTLRIGVSSANTDWEKLFGSLNTYFSEENRLNIKRQSDSTQVFQIGQRDQPIVLAIQRKLADERLRLAEAGRLGDLPPNTWPVNLEDPASNDIRLEVRAFGWLGMFDALGRNEVDLIVSSITRTRGREDLYGIAFSEPYIEMPMAIVYRNDGGKPFKSIREFQDAGIEVSVNPGYRSEEVGRLLLGDALDVQGFPTSKQFEMIDQGELSAVFSDEAGLYREWLLRQSELGLAPEAVRFYAVTEADFQLVLGQLRAAVNGAESEAARERISARIGKIESLMRDYGGAANEQYGVAVNADAGGRLLDEVVDPAIVDLRLGYANAAELFGRDLVPERPFDRLFGPGQVLEDDRRAASVRAEPVGPTLFDINGAESAARGVGGAGIDIPVVMGEAVRFGWSPIDRGARGEASSPSRFRFQVARDSSFTAGSVLIDRIREAPDYEHGDAGSDEDFRGLLYWRAKALPPRANPDAPDDPFPSDGWCPPQPFEYYRDNLDRVVRTGELRIAINFANGYSFYHADDGGLRGFDHEIIESLADRLGEALPTPQSLEIVPIDMAFGEMFKAVQTRRVDLAISGITKTAERERDLFVKFSTPYARTSQAAIWIAGQHGSLGDVVCKRIAVLEGSRAEEMALHMTFIGDVLAHGEKPKFFLLDQLAAGEADAAVTDYPTALKLIEDLQKRRALNEADEYAGLEFVVQPITNGGLAEALGSELWSDESFFDDPYAIAMANDQLAFVDEINRALADLKAQGGGQKLLKMLRDHEPNVEADAMPPFRLVERRER